MSILIDKAAEHIIQMCRFALAEYPKTCEEYFFTVGNVHIQVSGVVMDDGTFAQMVLVKSNRKRIFFRMHNLDSALNDEQQVQQIKNDLAGWLYFANMFEGAE